ncbi:mid1-interacting protein 1 isoform X1 [Petaurus breviceps papuanus]|uniref:mid1-interacting protein 1 isoform X1 n=1 Tax=Petaurus breviceps papuanus TaxID=3040969 RepID=UPI0036D76AF3
MSEGQGSKVRAASTFILLPHPPDLGFHSHGWVRTPGNFLLRIKLGVLSSRHLPSPPHPGILLLSQPSISFSPPFLSLALCPSHSTLLPAPNRAGTCSAGFPLLPLPPLPGVRREAEPGFPAQLDCALPCRTPPTPGCRKSPASVTGGHWELGLLSLGVAKEGGRKRGVRGGPFAVTSFPRYKSCTWHGEGINVTTTTRRSPATDRTSHQTRAGVLSWPEIRVQRKRQPPVQPADYLPLPLPSLLPPASAAAASSQAPCGPGGTTHPAEALAY